MSDTEDASRNARTTPKPDAEMTYRRTTAKFRPCAEESCDYPVLWSGGPRGLRSDAAYCSDACRMRAYRKRKKSH